MSSASPGSAKRDRLKIQIPDTPYERNSTSPRSSAFVIPNGASSASRTRARTRMLSSRRGASSRTRRGPSTGRVGSAA